MRQMSAALKAHLRQEVTTLCTCWKATLRNGTMIGFTDHTRDLTFEGSLYKSSGGYTPTAVEASCMLNVDNMEVEGLLGTEVTEIDLRAGLWDNAKVLVFWLNYADVTMGKLVMKAGTVGQLTIKDTSFTAEIRGLTQAYATMIGEITSSLCRARLGDARCKVGMTPYTFTGSIDTIDATNRVFTSSSLTQPGPTGSIAVTGISRAQRAVVTLNAAHTFGAGSGVLIRGVIGVVRDGATDNLGVVQEGSGASVNNYTYGIADVTATSFSIPVDTRLGSADANNGPEYALEYSDYTSGGEAIPQGNTGYFTFGMVTFTSGGNIGLSMEVKSYVPGLVELQLPMPYPINVGDAYTITKGCGKRFNEDCRDGFNNVVNFRGEPHIPGQDQTIQVGGPATPPT